MMCVYCLLAGIRGHVAGRVVRTSFIKVHALQVQRRAGVHHVASSNFRIRVVSNVRRAMIK